MRKPRNTIFVFFFNDTAITEIYTLSLHDALPITSLQQAPLRGHAAEYLRSLSMEMTERGEITIVEADARTVVNSASARLQAAGQIASAPDPGEILDELSKRHILVRTDEGEISFRFQHQQFQEFF